MDLKQSDSLQLIKALLVLFVCLTCASFLVQATDTVTALKRIQSPDMLQEVKTQTPVIGILTEVLRDYKRFTPERHLHIAASYVKWVESAGAKALPVLLNQNDSYYEQVFNQTNGLLFPGGDNLLDPQKRTPMMVAAKKLYKLAIEANDRGDFYPIWGTCLGLELLSVLTANKNVLEQCSATDTNFPLKFSARGRLFAPSNYSGIDIVGVDYAKVIQEALSDGNLTYNYHHKCLTDEGLKKTKLDQFYKPLAYSYDENGLKFVAIFEAFDYPFYGVQFHPEKPPFEFVTKKSQQKIPHSREAIAVSRYFADFFIMEAQKSDHKLINPLGGPTTRLIYSFEPLYTAPMKDMYEQRYLFPYKQDSKLGGLLAGTISEEFIDYHPKSDEEVDEEVEENQRGRKLKSNRMVNRFLYCIK